MIDATDTIEEAIDSYLAEVDPNNEVASVIDIRDLAENVKIILERAGVTF